MQTCCSPWLHVGRLLYKHWSPYIVKERIGSSNRGGKAINQQALSQAKEERRGSDSSCKHGQQLAVLPGLRPPLRRAGPDPDRPPQRPGRGVRPPRGRRRDPRREPEPRAEQAVLAGRRRRRAADPHRLP